MRSGRFTGSNLVLRFKVNRNCDALSEPAIDFRRIGESRQPERGRARQQDAAAIPVLIQPLRGGYSDVV